MEGGRLQKRLERGILSQCSINVFYCIYSYIWYITNLYVDVGKLSNHLQLCVFYLFTLDQFLFYVIIQTVSNELRFIMLSCLMRFHYYMKNSNPLVVMMWSSIPYCSVSIQYLFKTWNSWFSNQTIYKHPFRIKTKWDQSLLSYHFLAKTIG